jgi:hypothetical protein
MFHIISLAATLNMYGEATPCGEGSVAHGALWQTIIHILGYQGNISTKSGDAMCSGEMSAQDSHVCSGKSTMRAHVLVIKAGLILCHVIARHGEA